MVFSRCLASKTQGSVRIRVRKKKVVGGHWRGSGMHIEQCGQKEHIHELFIEQIENNGPGTKHQYHPKNR